MSGWGKGSPDGKTEAMHLGQAGQLTEQQTSAATQVVLRRVDRGSLSRLEAHRVLHALGLCLCDKEVG